MSHKYLRFRLAPLLQNFRVSVKVEMRICRKKLKRNTHRREPHGLFKEGLASLSQSYS